MLPEPAFLLGRMERDRCRELVGATRACQSLEYVDVQHVTRSDPVVRFGDRLQRGIRDRPLIPGNAKRNYFISNYWKNISLPVPPSGIRSLLTIMKS